MKVRYQIQCQKKANITAVKYEEVDHAYIQKYSSLIINKSGKKYILRTHVFLSGIINEQVLGSF